MKPREVDNSPGAVEPASDVAEERMGRREVRLADGRMLIFYTFESDGAAPGGAACKQEAK